MLKVYTPINNDIYKAHLLIEFLVDNVWCVADNSTVKTKLNQDLKKIYEEYDWFKNSIDKIYKVCKGLTLNEKDAFKKAFHENNCIEELCTRDKQAVPLNSLNQSLLDVVIPFFKELYTKFLGWKLVYDKFGTKTSYYKTLILKNQFKECPCCGFGDIKSIYSEGHSPYDHYLPQKHYPFSAINFHNLVPMCHTCNSTYKGETDILQGDKKIFYPFSNIHPNIEVYVTVSKKHLPMLITSIEDNGDFLESDAIAVNFNIDDDKIESWNSIFKIKGRYFAKIADYRVAWLNDVREKYKIDKDRIQNYSFLDAFDDIIKSDSNKHLGFLKSPYLKNLKSYDSLIKAMEEVSTHSIISL